MSRPARLPLEQLQPYLVDAPHPRHVRPEFLPVNPPRLDWARLFGNRHPVEIEVGFGKGAFLVASGQARPETNFLGIEIERKYTLATAARLAKHRLTNVKVLCTEARWWLKTYVAAASVHAVHVYFPDPWWKTRHKKRLLFTSDFASEVARVLETSGTLEFATDVEDYFRNTLELVGQLPQLRMLPEARLENSVPTNFERKYLAEGRPIHRARFQLSAP